MVICLKWSSFPRPYLFLHMKLFTPFAAPRLRISISSLFTFSGDDVGDSAASAIASALVAVTTISAVSDAVTDASFTVATVSVKIAMNSITPFESSASATERLHNRDDGDSSGDYGG